MNTVNACSSGSLVRESSRSGFSVAVGTDLQPGDGRRGEITIVNLGAIPADVRLSEHGVATDFAPGLLALAVDELDGAGWQRIFLGEIDGLPAEGIDLGRFAAGESRSYRFTVLLKKDTPEDELGSATASFEWQATLSTAASASEGTPELCRTGGD